MEKDCTSKSSLAIEGGEDLKDIVAENLLFQDF